MNLKMQDKSIVKIAQAGPAREIKDLPKRLPNTTQYYPILPNLVKWLGKYTAI